MRMHFFMEHKFSFFELLFENYNINSKGMTTMNVDGMTFQHMWVESMWIHQHKRWFVNNLVKINIFTFHFPMFAKETFQKLLFLNRLKFSHTSSVPFKKPNDAKICQIDIICNCGEFPKKSSSPPPPPPPRRAPQIKKTHITYVTSQHIMKWHDNVFGHKHQLVQFFKN